MSADPTRRPIAAERALCVGPELKKKRAAIGWSRRYAATRLSITEAELAQYEQNFPIMQGQYTRFLRVYNRTLFKLTTNTARGTTPGRFQ